MNKSKLLQLALLSSVGLTITACNSGSSSSSPAPGPSAQAIPASYQCLPSNLPTSSSVANSLKIAYASNCSVASAPQSTDLQKMAVALEKYHEVIPGYYPTAGFYNICTGTPIQYNPATGVTFIVTAAHCVTGTTVPKAAGAPTTAANISTYVESLGHNQAWIYQGTNAGGLQTNQLTAQILAVYVPSQYCQQAAYSYESRNGEYSCNNPNLSLMNGDFAVLKVQAQAGMNINIASNVKLAPSNLNMTSIATNLLVLGYGGTNPNGTVAGENSANSQLNYINTQYFGTNSYAGITASMTIMNGYLSNNIYYGLICGGDSGGGDFAWDGTNWNLVGVHSWGGGTQNPLSPENMECGVYGSSYVSNVSADVRQFNSWINTVLTQDNQATGCVNLGSAYACASGTGK